jgi:signal transduction histidine kinase
MSEDERVIPPLTLATRARTRAGSLSRQFALAVAIVVAPVLLALVVVGLLMVVSIHDAVLLAVIVAVAGILAIVAARLLARGILVDVQSIRDGLSAVRRGERDVQIDTSARDELAELAGAAKAMIAQLRSEEGARDQADAARRNLVAAVSHDLRTPLTSLRLLAEAVEDEIVDEQTRVRYLQRMRTHIEALGSLIDDPRPATSTGRSSTSIWTSSSARRWRRCGSRPTRSTSPCSPRCRRRSTPPAPTRRRSSACCST